MSLLAATQADLAKCIRQSRPSCPLGRMLCRAKNMQEAGMIYTLSLKAQLLDRAGELFSRCVECCTHTMQAA